ncbi:hypothetical protein CcaverHIS002_0412000 [Cutaneotrichosporon cavernicola]|nr:hypothetical protein CcaverHIS002_0412000 [Cutaneotrichosporon cavernicola]BEJ00141.1 hypothetical protein CcaverHIS631_0411830 [Cutaneotrichosporon cavernicola]BEJ07913.1 hypothetical protein CcaverHIS641_0411820 [Cutaneotrichosporon cavernicola]
MASSRRTVVPVWDDYHNFQLGPALLYVAAPLDLFAPPPSPQGSFSGKFPHRLDVPDSRYEECSAIASEDLALLRIRSPPLASDDRSKAAKGVNFTHRIAPSERLTHASVIRAHPTKKPTTGNATTSSCEPLQTPTPVSPKSKHLSWGGRPTSISPTRLTAPTSHTFHGAPLNPDPTSRNRLSRRSTLTLSLSGVSRHRVRQWRSSSIEPLAVRLVTPTSPTPTSEPPGVWEEDGDDPYASVRERISTCQDRITEHAWVLAYGTAALAQKGQLTSTHATEGISHSELLDASLPSRRGSGSLLPPGPNRRSRRFSFAVEPDIAGWKRESARASKRIEHFEHLQEHYLGLMATQRGRTRTAHVRTYNWGCEREGLRSA